MLHFAVSIIIIGQLLIVKGDSIPNFVDGGKFNTSLQQKCFDVFGKAIEPGASYVPGPDYCTVCQCENGTHRFCRAVLCQPRQDCSSFRTGATCCDFICLDDVLSNPNDDRPLGNYPHNPENSLGVRLAAAILTALFAFVLLLFLVHRLRQRRITAQQYVNAQDACCHAQAYWHSSDQARLFLHGAPPFPHWKPPDYAMDAPPPYTEDDARRAELCMASSSTSNQSSSAVGLVTNPLDRTSHQAVRQMEGYSLSHSRTESLHDGTYHLTSRNERQDRHDAEGASGHSRNNSSSFSPANLGPLAVQLLPTGALSNNNLREQIQRQRQNLTANVSSRTLPRAFSNQRNNDLAVASGSRDDRYSLTCVYDEGQHSSQPNIREVESEEQHSTLQLNEEVEVLISSEDEIQDSGECLNEEEMSQENMQLSHVRKSVMRFEAAAAAASDSSSHESPKH